MSASTALKMATMNGAKALGLEDTVGSLESGKAADIIAVSTESIEMMPMYCAISHLVYVATRDQYVWLCCYFANILRIFCEYERYENCVAYRPHLVSRICGFKEKEC